MTFEEMKDVVKSFCNLNNTESDLRVGRALNRHYRRVTAECGLDVARFVTRTATTTNGVQTVTFSEIEKVDRINNTTSGVDPLREISLDHQRTITPGTGQPATWAKQTTSARTFTVRLDTVPQDTWTLQADGWATLSDLVGTDEPAFPESFHDILVFAVIAEELLKKEKDKLALVYETKSADLLRRLQFHLADSYSQVTKARNEEAQSGSTSGGGGTGGSTLGGTAYTQSALVTFDRGVGLAPFAVAAGSAKVANLNADTLDGLDSSDFLQTTGHATTHQNGGTDEITVAGLSGLLADAQTPLAHAASHASGSTDPIKLDDLATPDDNTDLNATTTRHGLLKKLSGSATDFMNGLGAFANPVAGSDTHVLFNDVGNIGADSGMTYAKLTDALTVGSVSLSNGQVVFPAAQNASSNANTLDDYEEGTYTPTDSSGASLSLTVEGTYIKIGQSVTVSAIVTFPATGSGAAITLGGLPFTIKDTTADFYVGPVIADQGVGLSVLGVNNTTTLVARFVTTAGVVQNVDMSGKTMRFTLTYRATA